MARKIRIIVAGATIMFLVGMALSVVELGSQQSSGATTTCGPSGHWNAGLGRTPQTNYYVQANITTNIPGLCGATYSSSAAWTMIANSDLTIPSGFGYAQSGYLRTYGNSTVMFSEYLQCATCGFHRRTGAAPPSGSPLYDEVYNFSLGAIQMYVDNNTYLLDTTNFDPAFSWTAPWVPQWSGETHAQGDDMPGSASAPTYFSNLLIKRCRSCSLTTPTGMTLNVTSTRYGVAWDSVNSKFHIWTK
ncbi:MAG: hypothetical protein ACYDB2_02355 [Acidimicrobiales bacterium]